MRVVEVFHDKMRREYRLTCVVTEEEMRKYTPPSGDIIEKPMKIMDEAAMVAAKEQEEFMRWWRAKHHDPKARYEERVKTLAEVPWTDDVVMFVHPGKEIK